MSSSTLQIGDRDIRQRELVPPLKLAVCQAVVVGVGAIGRQVALQLAAVGIGKMDLVDFDVVGVENLAPQAYWQSDLGKSKVEATAHACRLLNPAVRISEYNERFRRSSPRTLAAFADRAVRPVVFCCVDSIATRQLVWEAVRPMAAFFADGRMSAEVIRILAVGQPALDAYYATTLFAPEQAYQGSCTSRSTVYTASIAAALMLSQFTRSLREMPVDRDLHLNLLSSELSVH
jgi:molybdopterin/thiamine biosynthesis adenylyltransferase